MKTVDIIIPTFNQPEHLGVTLRSLFRWTRSSFKVYVVDNSLDGYAAMVAGRVDQSIVVLRPGSNTGWMGGVNFGAASSTSEYILMLNDDVKILDFDHLWLQKLLEGFANYPEFGAIAPSSNFVMGYQNFMSEPMSLWGIVSCLSGMALLTPRKVFEQAGGLDESLPGGDDLDYSIKVRKLGYRLAVRKSVFIYHFGSLTGKSVHGDHWNSKTYRDDLTMALVKKHGLSEFLIAESFIDPDADMMKPAPDTDWEYCAMIPFLKGTGIDVGCGNRKVKPSAIGVDLTPNGEVGTAGSQLGRKSQADISVAGTSLPFPDGSMDYVHARHVLEHIVDPVAALREWVRVLKPSGKLVIACPDETVVDGILLDPSHKHAYTLDSYKTLLGLITPFKILMERQHDISFVSAVEVFK